MKPSPLMLIVGLAGIALPVEEVMTSAQSARYTHFVRPDGSATSFCTASEPCSLTRAVSLIGSASMRPGSVVLLQHGIDGVYSQATLTLDGSGTADDPIRFIGENLVRLTGTRTKPPANEWARVPDRHFTYRMPWDAFTVGTVAQRPPVSTWRPIRVDDRLPPFTQSLGRPFSLDFPIRYTGRSSVDQVEAQHCTFWHDTRSAVVYVHMCHDGKPEGPDQLYLSPSGWGAVVINGDNLTLENVAIEHVNGTGLKVNPSADGTVLRRITARAAQVWLEGVNTLAEDLDISHVITQGTHPTQCYDANPDFGAGECWNAGGDGRALLVGRERRTTSFGQVVRRAKVHRSWNGARVDGRQTLQHSTIWGFPNHALEASGTGGVFRHNVILNAQDSIFLGTNPFDDLTVEHNIFVNSAYFTVSNHGNGGTTPTIGWRFRYNILAGIVFDEKTFSTVDSDCNLYIPHSGVSSAMKVIATDGGRAVDYDTLDEIRSKTPLDRRSMMLPPAAWTDRALFRHYVGQASSDFDFSPASAQPFELCGRRIGPETTLRLADSRGQN